MIFFLGVGASAQEGRPTQMWEFGVLGGGSIYSSDSVSGPAGSGSVGIKNGPAVGVFLGSNGRKFGGELRYDFLPGDLKLSSGGTNVGFSGMAHAIHYDAMYYFTPKGSRIRPFISGGAGVKVYQGTGSLVQNQPLGGLALLTDTHEAAALGTFGGGVKAKISRRVMFRAEVQDYLTPFPRQVIAEGPGAKINGMLHDIVFTAGIGFVF